MRFFNNLGEILETLSKTVIFTILAIADAGLTLAYFYLSKDLIKPSGFWEAFQFLLDNAEGYLGSLFTGMIAFALTIVLIIVAIVNLGRYIFNSSDDSIVIAIVKLVVAIILVVTTNIYLSGLGGIAFTMLVIAGLIYLLTSN